MSELPQDTSGADEEIFYCANGFYCDPHDTGEAAEIDGAGEIFPWLRGVTISYGGLKPRGLGRQHRKIE